MTFEEIRLKYKPLFIFECFQFFVKVYLQGISFNNKYSRNKFCDILDQKSEGGMLNFSKDVRKMSNIQFHLLVGLYMRMLRETRKKPNKIPKDVIDKMQFY